MKIIECNPKDLKPYPNNPRINDDAVQKVCSSIKEFGFQQPIVVDKDMVVIVGHTRLKASIELKLEKVPVVIANGLSEEQTKAYRLADNKVAEFSDWDMEKLEFEIENIVDFDMSEFGFDDFDEEENEVIEDEDFDATPPEEPISKLGDVYQLGRHRLMCGDSTSEGDIKKLTGDNKMDMVFTDPPYNIDYKGLNDDRKIKNDKMSDDDFIEFLKKSIMPSETVYVCCSWQYSHLFKQAMTEIGIAPKAMIIWNKVNPAQHLDKYFKQHELIYYFGKFGGQKTLRGDVWEVKRERNTVHPTMKPLSLISIALNDNPHDKTVYDGFGGSGSTLMACEQTNKTCYTMELDPRYVDVIIRRWEELTGEKALKIN